MSGRCRAGRYCREYRQQGSCSSAEHDSDLGSHLLSPSPGVTRTGRTHVVPSAPCVLVLPPALARLGARIALRPPRWRQIALASAAGGRLPGGEKLLAPPLDPVKVALLRCRRHLPSLVCGPCDAALTRPGNRSVRWICNVLWASPDTERTVRELMPVLSLCDQVDLWCYGRSAGLPVL